MKLAIKKVNYDELNARQQESYNFQKFSALLADYGFSTIRLTDDWQGADFIAQHIDGELFLKVQLKGRICFYKKYLGKDLWISCRDRGEWYLYPHDTVLKLVEPKIQNTESWRDKGGYSWGTIPEEMLQIFSEYKIL